MIQWGRTPRPSATTVRRRPNLTSSFQLTRRSPIQRTKKRRKTLTMNSIHRVLKSTSVLILLAAIFLSQTTLAANRHPAKAQRRTRPEQRQASAKVGRAARRREEARRRAQAARLAAIARQRAAQEAIRNRLQTMIDKDDVTGEDPEVRRIAVNALGNHAGTVVVMDPKSGRVFAIVNQQWAQTHDRSEE